MEWVVLEGHLGDIYYEKQEDRWLISCGRHDFYKDEWVAASSRDMEESFYNGHPMIPTQFILNTGDKR